MSHGRRCRLSPALVCLALAALACGDSRGAAPADAVAPPFAATNAAAAETPAPAFINLLPWSRIDFGRGRFDSLGDCNAFVRELPGYSYYTTSERCEPIEDPVYCTRWQDGDGPSEIDCFTGPGGCEAELPRHDMRVESAGRTLFGRCEPLPLAEAWTTYQAADR